MVGGKSHIALMMDGAASPLFSVDEHPAIKVTLIGTMSKYPTHNTEKKKHHLTSFAFMYKGVNSRLASIELTLISILE